MQERSLAEDVDALTMSLLHMVTDAQQRTISTSATAAAKGPPPAPPANRPPLHHDTQLSDSMMRNVHRLVESAAALEVESRRDKEATARLRLVETTTNASTSLNTSRDTAAPSGPSPAAAPSNRRQAAASSSSFQVHNGGDVLLSDDAEFLRSMMVELRSVEERAATQLQEQQRQFQLERQQWRMEKASLERRCRVAEDELELLSSEYRAMQDSLRQADRREQESREAMKVAASHFDNLQRVHEAELNEQRRQVEALRTTIAKLKLQTVQHDRSTATRQQEFSQLAEALARSRARCEVLESSVQHLVVQSQEKDEHLRMCPCS